MMQGYDFNPEIKMVNLRTRAQKRRAYNQIEKVRTKYERVMRPQLRSVFEAQKLALIKLDNPDTNDIARAIHSTDKDMQRVFVWMYTAMSDDIYPMIQRDSEKIKARFVDMEHKDTVVSGATESTYDGIMREYIHTVTGERITKINNTTLEAVQYVYDYSDNTVDFRDGVIEAFDKNIKMSRANTIARTETATASNASSMKSFRVLNEDSRIEKRKEWVTTLDDDVRDTHKPLDGMTLSLDELYRWSGKYGETIMDYPTDDGHGAGPEEIINCRCFIAYSSI